MERSYNTLFVTFKPLETLKEMKRFLLVFGIAVFSILSGSAQIVSDFTSNNEGWIAPSSSTGIQYSATGGNPGGYVFGIDPALASTFWYYRAPGKFTGNRSSYYNGTISFDVSVVTTQAAVQRADIILTNSAGISIYYFSPVTPTPGVYPTWTKYAVNLNELSGNWKTANSSTGTAATQAEIQNVLTSLLNFDIRGRYGSSINTQSRLDNVMFTEFTIDTQPTTTSVCLGSTTSFTIAASAFTTVTYQWQKFDGTFGLWNNLTNTGGYSGTTTTTLGINTATTGTAAQGSYRCIVSSTGAKPITSSVANLTVNALPTAPGATPNSACGPTNTVTLTATGGSAGQYRWYSVSSGGVASTQVNNTFVTPSISTTTTFYVAINNGTCESTRTSVQAIINTVTPPTTTPGSACGPSSAVVVSASGGSAGQYRWYTASSGGPASAQVNSTFTTPVISTTTVYYVAINNGTCESTRTAVTATIDIVTPPTTTNNSGCAPSASITVSASGGSAGQYRWYTASSGGPASAQVNSTFTTPVISATTVYYVAINNGTCESTRTPVTATIVTVNPPTTTGNSACGPTASVTVNATGGSAGQYRWYQVASGGAASAQTNSAYITPLISATTIFYVAINNGTCESVRTPVTATINNCTVNHPPIIRPVFSTTGPGGTVTIDLLNQISDEDGNLDASTFNVKIAPISGAPTSISSSSVLTINYSGITFSGTDMFTVEACDLSGFCSQKEFTVDFAGDIMIYNAISPNNDGKNDSWIIQNIDVLEDTKENHITVFNRWGDSVFEIDNYNNLDRVFNGLSKNGSQLPSGTYFYRIDFKSGRKTQNGYISLKR
ncbi:MAG: T9SS type B sorting domain-containing protein [Cyclobacteriaceae bacterium]|nr:T9SS type B sorting domain-containing protein [Cyclobacteriaceae bacterium]